jgi:hypothetical protein
MHWTSTRSQTISSLRQWRSIGDAVLASDGLSESRRIDPLHPHLRYRRPGSRSPRLSRRIKGFFAARRTIAYEGRIMRLKDSKG